MVLKKNKLNFEVHISILMLVNIDFSLGIPDFVKEFYILRSYAWLSSFCYAMINLEDNKGLI